MKRLSGTLGLALACALGLGATACGGDDDDKAPAPGKADIEVKGTWTNSDFGESDTIDDSSWASSFGGADPNVSTIIEYSNDAHDAVLLTPADAAFNPGTYERYVWTKPEVGSFYYCTASFGCASADQAKNGPADDTCTLSDVDATDLEGKGCGGFAWTKLTAP